MRRILLLAVLAAATAPQIEHPVTDLAEVLDSNAEESIARELVEHREKTGIQLAVLIVRTTGDQPIDDYAQEVFDLWGGGSKGRDDGALFVLAIDDHRSRLHLGYGLEPVIPDSRARRMLDELRPLLRREDYGGATFQLVVDFRKATALVTPGAKLRSLGMNPYAWMVVAVAGFAAGLLWGRARRRMKAEKSTRRVDQLWVAFAWLGQLAMAYLFRDSNGFLLVYSGVYWCFFAVGWAAGGELLLGRLGLCTGGSALLSFVRVLGFAPPGGIFADAATLLDYLLPTLGSIALLGLFLTVFTTFGKGSARGGGWSTGSSRGWTSGPSWTSSGSSRSSSSSSRSSSWSGGGGRSGGGGASSSW